MTKIVVFAIFALLSICQGYPQLAADLARAAMSGDWQSVYNLLGKDTEFPSLFAGTNIKDLKPVPDGKVYGEAQFAYLASNTDEHGNVRQSSHGHKILNNNGKITEYDFDPTLPKSGK